MVFFQSAALGTALTALAAQAKAVDTPKTDESRPKFRLGLVTYNLAAEWGLDQILRTCKAVGVSPVELRTTHKHGVEPSLSKDKRVEVKKKFALWMLASNSGDAGRPASSNPPMRAR